MTNTAALAQELRTVGYVHGTTLQYVFQLQAEHSAFHWAQRMPGALAFLLGPQ